MPPHFPNPATLAVALAITCIPIARAEHGGLKGFEQSTGHWYGISQTHVPNKAFDTTWAEDDSAAYFIFETPEGKALRKVSTNNGEITPIDKIPEGKKRNPTPAPQTQPPRWESPDGKWLVVKREGALFLRDNASGKTSEIALDDGNDSLTGKPLWSPDSTRFVMWKTKDVAERQLHLIESSPKDQLQPNDTFVFVYGNSFRHDLNDGDEILWMSERDGWKHLYLLVGKDGSVKRQLTKGGWIVRDVVEVDEKNREILLKISGCFPTRDPYLIHYVRVSSTRENSPRSHDPTGTTTASSDPRAGTTTFAVGARRSCPGHRATPLGRWRTRCYPC